MVSASVSKPRRECACTGLAHAISHASEHARASATVELRSHPQLRSCTCTPPTESSRTAHVIPNCSLSPPKPRLRRSFLPLLSPVLLPACSTHTPPLSQPLLPPRNSQLRSRIASASADAVQTFRRLARASPGEPMRLGLAARGLQRMGLGLVRTVAGPTRRGSTASA